MLMFSVTVTDWLLYVIVFFSYQFFLQVKHDIVQGYLPVGHELAAELAAYAVQCESQFFIFMHRVFFVKMFHVRYKLVVVGIQVQSFHFIS